VKDFDAERIARDSWPEETFQLAGKQFRLKPQMPARSLSAYADIETHMAETDRLPTHTFEAMVGIIRDSLHEGDQDAWDELTAADLQNPLTLGDMLSIANHIVTTSTGRPTTPLSASGTTEESGGKRLMVASDSTAGQEPKASTLAAG
jgi:hypothetical protein